MTGRAAIVLDGASAFDARTPRSDDYVDALLAAIIHRIDDLRAEVNTVLAHAVAEASNQLPMQPGSGPSAAVAIVRDEGERLTAVVLGDCTVVTCMRDGSVERLTDGRLSQVAISQRAQYRERLRSGAGFDARHRMILGDIQAQEREARNRDGGYWIAEADPDAAAHALRRSYPRHDVVACLVASDGAQRGFDHHAVDWSRLAGLGASELTKELRQLHSWEQDVDPDGVDLPRSKRHDDKAVVAVSVV